MKRIPNSLLFVSLASLGVGCGGNMKKMEHAQLKYSVAQNLLLKGETIQATAELLAARDLDPNNAEVRALLALTFVQTGHSELAEPEFRKAVELDPKSSEARNNFCVYLLDNKKFDAAIEQCMKAAENVTYSTPERAYHNMGLAYQGKGNAAKAIDSFSKALIHNPNFVMSRKSLGLLLINQNRVKEGVSQLEGASTVCGVTPKGAWGNECPEAYYQLGIMYLKLKERSKAVSVLKKCADADDQGAYGQKCRDNLKILE